MKNILCVIALALAVASCAKKEEEDYNLREQSAFDNWFKLNVLPDHPTATRTGSGIYIERLGKSHRQVVWPSDAMTPTDGTSWITVDYSARDLDGNVISTRREDVARKENTFTKVTHYVPHFSSFDTSAAYFSKGEYEALSTMAVGDSVRIWLPTMMGYGTASIAFSNGYEGWRYSTKNAEAGKGSSYTSKTVVVELALLGITSSPSDNELARVRDEVIAYNFNAPGEQLPLFELLTPAEGDTEAEEGQYYRITKTGTIEVTPEGGGAPETKPANLIPSDISEAIYIRYVCRFLDGKLVATNDSTIALAEWEAFGDLYTDVTSFYAASSSIIGSALNNLIKSGKMRYDSTAQMLITSTYAYGTNGKSSSAGSSSTFPNPVIYPYTPLFIEITTNAEETETE